MTTYPHLLEELAADEFQPLVTELKRKVLPVNHDRVMAGQGRTQAFGVIRRWSYRPWLSRNTWMRRELWALLLEFANKHVPIQWDAVQVNDNFQSAPHRDKGNHGVSYIVGFGDYVDGNLNVEGQSYNIRHRPHLFIGADQLHSTEAWTGQRYSLVFFRIVWPAKFGGGYGIQTQNVEDGIQITDGYDDSIMVLDPRGQLVRTVRQGRPMPWIGRLTSKGQPSRASTHPPTEQHDSDSESLDAHSSD